MAENKSASCRLTLLFIFNCTRTLSLKLCAHLVQQLGEPVVWRGAGAHTSMRVIHDDRRWRAACSHTVVGWDVCME